MTFDRCTSAVTKAQQDTRGVGPLAPESGLICSSSTLSDRETAARRYTRRVKSTFSKLWALLVIGTLLFAQGALAAYVCPTAFSGKAALEAPCADMDMDSTPLCQRHCADEKQKPHDSSTAFPPPFVPAFVVRLPFESDSARAAPVATPPEQAAPPPLILRNCCLRI